MIPDRIKTRLNKDRPMTSINLDIPQDVLDSLIEIAPLKGFDNYQGLLKAYIGEGLRHDEGRYAFGTMARLFEALKKRGVSAEVIEEATREVSGKTDTVA